MTGKMSQCEQAFSYFLGELRASEAKAFERHLQQCEHCRNDVAELRQVWTALPTEMELIDVPEALRAKVLDTALDKPERPERRKWLRAAGYAAAALLLFLSGGLTAALLGMGVSSKSGSPEQQQSSSSAQLVRLSTPMEVVNAYELKGFDQTMPAAGGQGWLTRQGEKAQLVLQLYGLPPTDGDQAYQVWIMRDGQRSNGGTFCVDRQGAGIITLEMNVSEAEFESIGITLEPDSRGSEPRGRKVLGT